MKPRQRRSRLATIEHKRTVQTITLSLFFIGVMLTALFYFGIPLLIKFASFASSIKPPQTLPPEIRQAIRLSAPVLDALPEATPSAKILVSGYGPAASTVTLFVNETDLPATLTDSGGAFKVQVLLTEGENMITARATNNAGDESPESLLWTVVRDSSPPSLTVTSPQQGQVRSGAADRIIDVQGTTETGSAISVNGRLAIVSGSGAFSSRIELKEGANELIIIATDPAGNQTQETLTLTWTP